MAVDALLKLRADIDAHIADRRRDIERLLTQLSTWGKSGAKRGRKPRAERDGAPAKSAKRRAHPLRGKKRPAKFLDPATGATWAGVGMRPRWLTDYEAQGRKREEFAVEPSAASARGKAPAKKRGRPAKAKNGRKRTAAAA